MRVRVSIDRPLGMDVMPELPEVEAAAKQLRNVLVGRTIVRATVRHAAIRRSLSVARARKLAGRRVVAVERRGKHQVVRLDDGTSLLVHFRMTGDWTMSDISAPVPRFARFSIDLDDGRAVHLDDPRALAVVSLHVGDPPLPPLGPEPDAKAFTADALGAALQGRRIAIKPAMLDQRVVAGLGNIYAAEALWHARLSPFLRADSLTAAQRRALVSAIRKTIAGAHRAPGRYSSGVGRGMNVYDREGERCTRCGATIDRTTQSGRSTYWCAGCQV